MISLTLKIYRTGFSITGLLYSPNLSKCNCFIFGFCVSNQNFHAGFRRSSYCYYKKKSHLE